MTKAETAAEVTGQQSEYSRTYSANNVMKFQADCCTYTNVHQKF